MEVTNHSEHTGKDVRERLGQSVMNNTQDPKTGKWKGGDQGINEIQNQFGWSTDMIKKYQNNPLDFAGAVANEGQRRGMNSAQIGHLLENLGDDMSYYSKMFANSGAEYKQIIDEMVRAGAAITPELEEATAEAAKFNQALTLAGIGLSNNFTEGFMSALGGVDGFQDAMRELNPAAKWLGSEIGDLVHQFTNLINSTKNVVEWWDNHFGAGAKNKQSDVKDAITAATQSKPYVDPNTGIAGANPAATANAAASGDNLWNYVKGFADRLSGADSSVSNMFNTDNVSSIAGSNLSAQNMNMFTSKTPFYQPAPIQVNLPDIIVQSTLNANTDEWSRMLDYKTLATFNNGMQGVTLGMNSSMSATGSN